jgi:hypothetical protein
MLVALCIVLFSLTILSYPLHFHVEGSLDAFVSGGQAKLYFFGIRIFKVKLRLDNDADNHHSIYIESFKKSKLLSQVNLSTDLKDKYSIASLLTGSILGNVNVTDCFVNIEIGRTSDAIFSAMGLTFVRMAYCAFMSFVKSWQRIRTQERFVPVYDKNIFNIEFLGIFTFDIADIIYGLIAQIIKK